MIFILRLIVFSLLIWLGFECAVKSCRLRAVVSVIYGFILLYYTFLCRMHLILWACAGELQGPVSVRSMERRSAAEQLARVLKAVFGMQPNGNLGGTYSQAFVLNMMLFVPLGYLCMMWLTDAEQGHGDRRIRTSLLICVLVSLAIEVCQEITGLGMFDGFDLLANALGGAAGVAAADWYQKIQ